MIILTKPKPQRLPYFDLLEPPIYAPRGQKLTSGLTNSCMIFTIF